MRYKALPVWRFFWEVYGAARIESFARKQDVPPYRTEFSGTILGTYSPNGDHGSGASRLRRPVPARSIVLPRMIKRNTGREPKFRDEGLVPPAGAALLTDETGSRYWCTPRPPRSGKRLCQLTDDESYRHSYRTAERMRLPFFLEQPGLFQGSTQDEVRAFLDAWVVPLFPEREVVTRAVGMGRHAHQLKAPELDLVVAGGPKGHAKVLSLYFDLPVKAMERLNENVRRYYDACAAR